MRAIVQHIKKKVNQDGIYCVSRHNGRINRFLQKYKRKLPDYIKYFIVGECDCYFYDIDNIQDAIIAIDEMIDEMKRKDIYLMEDEVGLSELKRHLYSLR